MKVRTAGLAALLLALVAGCGDSGDEESAESTQPAMETMEPMQAEADAPATNGGVTAPPPVRPDYGPNDIVHAMADRQGHVQLLLTPSHLTMKLDRETAELLRSQVSARGIEDELKLALLETLQQAAAEEIEATLQEQRPGQQAEQPPERLIYRIRYPLEAINAMHYQSGRLWIDVERDGGLSFDDVKLPDGRPALASFDEQASLQMVDAFRAM